MNLYPHLNSLGCNVLLGNCPGRPDPALFLGPPPAKYLSIVSWSALKMPWLRPTWAVILLAASVLVSASACSAKKVSPDSESVESSTPSSALAGGALGTAWGGGAGWVVGHQLSYAAEGAAIGAGFGLVNGVLMGIGYGQLDDRISLQEQRLLQLKQASQVNGSELAKIQDQLDYGYGSQTAPQMFVIYFDPESTSLRAGAINELEVIAEAVKKNPYARLVIVRGHSDDGGSQEYNQRTAESRARSVASMLSARGIPMDQIKVEGLGSSQPLANNSSPEGRQLNRRVEILIKP